jgi:acyl-CoA synthetase (AMP-forming)/AMP-acid ligase II
VTNNLADRFEEMADAVPNRFALISVDELVTFGELDARANRMAHHLADHGVRAHEAVGLMARNSVAFVVSFLACFKIRAVPVNINYRYVAAELRALLADSGAVAIVLDEDLADECGGGAIEGILEPHHTVVIGDKVGALGPRATTYSDALTSGSPKRDFDPRSGDDLHMLFTGGTTGRPKGVVWRHEDTLMFTTGGAGTDAALATARGNPELEPVVMFPAGPFVHASPQWVLIGALTGGMTTVVLDRFDAETIWDLCEREGVQFLSINGDAMARPLIDSLDRRGKVPSSINSFSSSGGTLSSSNKADLVRLFPDAVVFDAVGSTETGLLGIAPADGSNSGQLRLSASPDTIVVDETGRPVCPGVRGLLAKSGFIPLRYHNDPEGTARSFIVHEGTRYAIPGDEAVLNDDGTITLLGRQSSCINTGAEKVYPNEVEDVLLRHLQVRDCVVLGMPDERWGQRVCALVAIKGSELDVAALRTHARAHLAGYKIPRSFHRVDQIPRQATGKPDYRWVERTAQSVFGPDDAVR